MISAVATLLRVAALGRIALLWIALLRIALLHSTRSLWHILANEDRSGRVRAVQADLVAVVQHPPLAFLQTTPRAALRTHSRWVFAV